MLIQILISMFGIAFIHRNLSLLEKTELISRSKLNFYFYFLQAPLFLHLVFKELRAFVLTYIGIFSITLILFDKIIDYFKEKEFEELHINVIERLILLLKTGKSAQVSAKNVFEELTKWQKHIFFQLPEIFSLKNRGSDQYLSKNCSQQFYFEELYTILHSKNNVIEQLRSFQRALMLEKNLRHRSRQATQMTKAQAMIAFLIYLAFVFLAITYLNLELLSVSMGFSLSLFTLGQFLIFRLGGRIKWQT